MSSCYQSSSSAWTPPRATARRAAVTEGFLRNPKLSTQSSACFIRELLAHEPHRAQLPGALRALQDILLSLPELMLNGKGVA